MNPPGVFKKNRGKRDLGEKFDSKFYPKNYKKDVIYMNYEDLLDNLYMEKKGIDYQLRPSNNNMIINDKKENQMYNDFNFENNSNNNNINANSNYNKENNDFFKNNKNEINNDNNDFLKNNKNDTKNINKKNNTNEENEDDEIIMKTNKNNQFTFSQKSGNNFDLNFNKNENNIKLRGRPNKIKSDIINKDNNLSNRYNNNDNCNIPEEGEEQNNDIENENNDNNEDNDINNHNLNDIEDSRLSFVLQKLGLESLIKVFESYHMSFNDLLFLSKDDLNELGFKIYQKNRLISFIEEYTSKAKNYTLEEIKTFFDENSLLNISSNQE